MSSWFSVGVYLGPIILWALEAWYAHKAYPTMKLRDAIFQSRVQEEIDFRHQRDEKLLKQIAAEALANRKKHGEASSAP